MRLPTLLLAVFLSALSPLQAQETNHQEVADTNPFLEGERESLTALYDSLHAKEELRAQLHASLREAGDELSRAELKTQIIELNVELKEVQKKFRRIALAVDTSIFETDAKQPFDIQKELEQLVQPVISELKQATADSRALEELRQEKAGQEHRNKVASEAVEHLDQLLDQELDELLRARLIEMRADWARRERDALNQLTAIGHQIEKQTPKKESVLNRSRDLARNFFQSRGLHLFLGVGAFVLVFLFMRGIAWLYRKIRPERKNRGFGDRLGSLLWSLFTIIGAVCTMMLVFNLTADWFLLSLTVIFLLGLGWAGFQTIPRFLELFRLMLNLGAVKEGERVMWDDIPWNVESIGFVTRLVNPLLDGGLIMLPTRMIVGAHSRPKGDHEEWFPCKQSDWILLRDGTYGRVSYQTPSLVQVVCPGGSQKMYPTADFLDHHPQVLSTGFRIEALFGIDSGHLEIATTEILPLMQESVETCLSESLGDSLNSIRVELEKADAISIEYRILVDCTGQAANRWDHIPREVSQCLVTLCNQKVWSIPRQQIMLHRKTMTEP